MSSDIAFFLGYVGDRVRLFKICRILTQFGKNMARSFFGLDV